MNAFGSRAQIAHCLKSLFEVLARELDEEGNRKKNEIKKFDSLKGNVPGLVKYQKDSGLTKDVCERIYKEVLEDQEHCRIQLEAIPELNAVDGEKSLKTLYQGSSGVKLVWNGTKGQKPVDLIVVSPNDPSVLMGDCKFGIKSDECWIIRNEDQFKKEFADKFSSVGYALMSNDSVMPKSEMLLITTSALSPLLKNRMEDYKLDPRYSGISYDDVHVCSVDDIYEICQKLLVW